MSTCPGSPMVPTLTCLRSLSAAIGNANYGEHFIKAEVAEDSNCQHYVDCETKEEWSGVLLGQTCTTAYGTRLCAIGTHYTGAGSIGNNLTYVLRIARYIACQRAGMAAVTYNKLERCGKKGLHD